jgi:hypothetical protein
MLFTQVRSISKSQSRLAHDEQKKSFQVHYRGSAFLMLHAMMMVRCSESTFEKRMLWRGNCTEDQSVQKREHQMYAILMITRIKVISNGGLCGCNHLSGLSCST